MNKNTLKTTALMLAILPFFNSCKNKDKPPRPDGNPPVEENKSYINFKGSKLDFKSVYLGNFLLIEKSNEMDTLLEGIPVYDNSITITDGTIFKPNAFQDSMSDDFTFYISLSFNSEDSANILQTYNYNEVVAQIPRFTYGVNLFNYIIFGKDMVIKNGEPAGMPGKTYFDMKSGYLKILNYTSNKISFKLKVEFEDGEVLEGEIIDFSYQHKPQ